MKIAGVASATAVVCGLLCAAPVSAHHSFAAEWDSRNCREFTGTLTRIDWQNPHPYFYVDVKDASGKVENWSFQAYSPVTLRGTAPIGACFSTTWARKCGSGDALRRTTTRTPPPRGR